MRADAAARTRDGKSVVELAGLNNPSRVEDKDEFLRLFYDLYWHSSSGVEGQEIQRKIVEEVKDGMVVSCGFAMDKPNWSYRLVTGMLCRMRCTWPPSA